MKALKDGAIYLIGELISRAMPFLLLPYLSRKLGVEGFGELSYYQTFSVLFFIIIGLSQEGAITRYFYRYGKRSLNLVITSGYTYTLFVGSIILIICGLLQSESLIYVALTAIFQSFVGVQLNLRQCQKKALSYAFLQFLLSLSTVLFTVLLLEFFHSYLVEKRLLAVLLGYVLVFFVAYFMSYKQNNYKRIFHLKQYVLALSYILSFGIPLILHNASLFLKGQLDRIFIFYQFSQADLGLYAMGAQIAAILMIVLQAINKATIPYLFEGLKQQHFTLTHIHRWVFFSLLIVPVPALVMWLIPESIIIWLLGQQFLGTKYYIVLFLFSTALTIPYFILVNYLFYYGKNKLITLCSILSTVIYLISLITLTFTEIKYIPYASIFGGVAIIPILFFMTKRVGIKQ